MTSQDLTADSIKAALTSDVEMRLATVRDRIGSLKATLNELQDAETVLVNVLATVTSGVSPIPEQRTQDTGSVPVTPDIRQSHTFQVEEPSVPPVRSTGPSATEARAPSGKAARGPVRKGRSAASPEGAKAPKKSSAASVTLPERVGEFLLTNPGPQKISEIAQALFGADATPTQGNQVRTAAEALARRGEVEKDRQGQSVFYQTVTTVKESASVAAAEASATDEG